MRRGNNTKSETLDRPKDFGGLGFLNVRVMNIRLMCKWIEKLEIGEDSVCCDL
jgi:hypothetical protein